MEFFKTLFRLTKMSTIWLHMFLFQFEEAGTINMFPIFCQFFYVNVEGCIWKFCNDCNVLILDNVFAKLKNVVKNYNNKVFSYRLMANFQTIHYMYTYNYVCNNTIFKQRLLNPEFVNIPTMQTFPCTQCTSNYHYASQCGANWWFMI